MFSIHPGLPLFKGLMSTNIFYILVNFGLTEDSQLSTKIVPYKSKLSAYFCYLFMHNIRHLNCSGDKYLFDISMSCVGCNLKGKSSLHLK